MVFFSLENLHKPGGKVMWIWLEIWQDIEDCTTELVLDLIFFKKTTENEVLDDKILMECSKK